jgi:hypothetical protein
MIKDDIYLSMLRFGKMKLADGFIIQNLVDFLSECGHKNISPDSTILHQYFFKVYFAKDNVESYPPNPTIRFYLRPECYMQLLEYNDMQVARKEAWETRWYAIIAIILTLASLVVSIFK